MCESTAHKRDGTTAAGAFGGLGETHFGAASADRLSIPTGVARHREPPNAPLLGDPSHSLRGTWLGSEYNRTIPFGVHGRDRIQGLRPRCETKGTTPAIFSMTGLLPREFILHVLKGTCVATVAHFHAVPWTTGSTVPWTPAQQGSGLGATLHLVPEGIRWRAHFPFSMATWAQVARFGACMRPGHCGKGHKSQAIGASTPVTGTASPPDKIRKGVARCLGNPWALVGAGLTTGDARPAPGVGKSWPWAAAGLATGDARPAP